MELIKKFNEYNVTILKIKSEVYFKAKDVAKLLEYVDPSKAVRVHVDCEYKMTFEGRTNSSIPPGEDKKTVFITFNGVIDLVFKSKMEKAKEFKKWAYELIKNELQMKTSKHTILINSENDLHKAFVKYFRETFPEDRNRLIAGLGEMQVNRKQDLIIDRRLEAYQKGYSKGQFDIMIDVCTIKRNGLAIEFKYGYNKPTAEQLQWEKNHKRNNRDTLITNDLFEAIRTVNNYMRDKRIKCEYCERRFKTDQSLSAHQNFIHRIIL
jgi:prophage antirepressor-like protein